MGFTWLRSPCQQETMSAHACVKEWGLQPITENKQTVGQQEQKYWSVSRRTKHFLQDFSAEIKAAWITNNFSSKPFRNMVENWNYGVKCRQTVSRNDSLSDANEVLFMHKWNAQLHRTICLHRLLRCVLETRCRWMWTCIPTCFTGIIYQRSHLDLRWTVSCDLEQWFALMKVRYEYREKELKSSHISEEWLLNSWPILTGKLCQLFLNTFCLKLLPKMMELLSPPQLCWSSEPLFNATVIWKCEKNPCKEFCNLQLGSD